jgi:hypothetical protein
LKKGTEMRDITTWEEYKTARDATFKEALFRVMKEISKIKESDVLIFDKPDTEIEFSVEIELKDKNGNVLEIAEIEQNPEDYSLNIRALECLANSFSSSCHSFSVKAGDELYNIVYNSIIGMSPEGLKLLQEANYREIGYLEISSFVENIELISRYLKVKVDVSDLKV